MKPSEVISAKIQTLLGSNYHIFSNTYFNKNYTEAREVREGENIGYARFTTAEYGKFRKDKIVGIFSITSSTRSNSNIYYLSGGYKIEFSVPRNVVKTTKYDEVISAPTYDFDANIETLINTVTNANIVYTVTEGQTLKTYNGRLTMSEPAYVMTESDGEYQYDIMTVSGNFVISDKAKFGKQYKVELGVGDAYVELDDINTFTESMNNDGNALVKQNKTSVEQNLSQSSWVCTVEIDDYQSNNLARQRIYSIIHGNNEIINSDEFTEANKRKQRVRITSPYGDVHIFNSIVSIGFNTTENGVGSYAVSFTDDNKDYRPHLIAFNSNGGTAITEKKSVMEGEAIGALPTPTKQDYVFSAWLLDNEPVNASTIYNHITDKTLVARWAQLDAPTITVTHSGAYDTATVTLSTDLPNAQIFYTLDGTTPDNTSSEYTEALVFAGGDVVITKTIKAVVYYDNSYSQVSSRTFTYGGGVT